MFFLTFNAEAGDDCEVIVKKWIEAQVGQAVT